MFANTSFQVFLFDADGVVIKRGEYYSHRYAKEAGIPLDSTELFFKNKFPDCLTGKADLKQVIAPYLPQWNWKGSVQDFLDHWFRAESELDTNIIKHINQLKQSGAIVALQSKQESYRARYLEQQLGFSQLFHHCYFSCDLGVAKPHPQFYQLIWQDLQTKHGIKDKSQVLYIDDEPQNTTAASTFGFTTHHFTSTKNLTKQLKS